MWHNIRNKSNFKIIPNDGKAKLFIGDTLEIVSVLRRGCKQARIGSVLPDLHGA